MSERDGKRIGIFGKTGSGKSILADGLIAGQERVFVFDPKGDWAAKSGYETLRHFAEVKQFLMDMGDGSFRAVYVPEALKAPKRLSTLGHLLLDWNKAHLTGSITRKVTLVVEEMADAFPVALPGGLFGFAELCQKGRAFGISIVGITQRPATVHASFRGNLNRIVAFKFSFPNDVKAIADAMEDAKVGDALAGLQPYHFINYADNEGWQVSNPVPIKP